MRPLLPILAFCTTTLVGGCQPSCLKTCKKLVACEDVDSPRVSAEDCANSCEIQQQIYENWSDTQKREDFDELKACIRDSECADIADGECYDEDVYIW